MAIWTVIVIWTFVVLINFLARNYWDWQTSASILSLFEFGGICIVFFVAWIIGLICAED